MADRLSPSVRTALDALGAGDNAAAAQLRLEFPQEAAPTVVVGSDTAGAAVTPAEARRAPLLFLAAGVASSSRPGQKFVAVSLDLDAPFPSFPLLSPVLHGMQTDLVVSEAPEGAAAAAAGELDRTGWVYLKSEAPPLVPYVGPGPPKPSGAHRYVFVLWKQPDGLDAAGVRAKLGWDGPVSRWDRMRYDVNTLLRGLAPGDIVAINYFCSQQ